MTRPLARPLTLAGPLALALLAGAGPAAAKMPFCTSVQTKIGDGSSFTTNQACGDNLARTLQVGNGTRATTDQVGRTNDAQSVHIGNGGRVTIRQREGF